MIPAKADPDAQEAYLQEVIQPRLDEAQTAQRAVFFVDAAHFVLAPFLGFLWSVTRLFIKAPSGRQRFNILGALNAITHELISVTNDTYKAWQKIRRRTMPHCLNKLFKMSKFAPKPTSR